MLRCIALQWRHHECDVVSNHQPQDCLPNHMCRCRSKKTSKLRVTGFCQGNSPVTGEFPSQRASYVEIFPFDDVIMGFGIRLLSFQVLSTMVAFGVIIKDGCKIVGLHFIMLNIQFNVCILSRQLYIFLSIKRHYHIETSSQGNAFGVTGPLFGEFTCHGAYLSINTNNVEPWCLFCYLLNNLARLSVIWGTMMFMWRHCYYKITIIEWYLIHCVYFVVVKLRLNLSISFSFTSLALGQP